MFEVQGSGCGTIDTDARGAVLSHLGLGSKTSKHKRVERPLSSKTVRAQETQKSDPDAPNIPSRAPTMNQASGYIHPSVRMLHLLPKIRQLLEVLASRFAEGSHWLSRRGPVQSSSSCEAPRGCSPELNPVLICSGVQKYAREFFKDDTDQGQNRTRINLGSELGTSKEF